MKRLLRFFIAISIAIIPMIKISAQNAFVESRFQESFIPEISLIGNNEEIPDGDSVASVKNNTHFGNVGLTQTKTREFFIQNSGPAGLVVSDINFTGENADEFKLADIPSYPINIDPNKNFSIQVVHTPKKGGTRSATINIINNDIDEGVYNVCLEAEATFTTVVECPGFLTHLAVYPNPAKDMTTVQIASADLQAVTIHVFNLQGQEVRPALAMTVENENQQIGLNTIDLDNGVYYVTLTSNKGEEKIKIAVMH